MDLERVSGWLQNVVTAKLTCRGCKRVTMIGLDKLLAMSAANENFTWWRERFKCQRCGARNPYLAVVPTHLTPMRYSPHPWASPNSDGEQKRDSDDP